MADPRRPGLDTWLLAAAPLGVPTPGPSASGLEGFPPPPAIDYGSYMLSIGIMLSILIILFLVSRYVAAKTGRGPVVGSNWGGGLLRASHIRVEDRQYLDPRKAVYIVQVEGRRFLLGASDQQVNLLTELDPTTPGNEVRDLPGTPEPPLPFIAHLSALMRRKPDEK